MNQRLLEHKTLASDIFCLEAIKRSIKGLDLKSHQLTNQPGFEPKTLASEIFRLEAINFFVTKDQSKEIGDAGIERR